PSPAAGPLGLQASSERDTVSPNVVAFMANLPGPGPQAPYQRIRGHPSMAAGRAAPLSSGLLSPAARIQPQDAEKEQPAERPPARRLSAGADVAMAAPGPTRHLRGWRRRPRGGRRGLSARGNPRVGARV